MKNFKGKSFDAFTMAEILLSLTIIGVVAAITLPSLTGNINERTWATQKKALFARMSQAFPLLDSINTFGSAESFIAGGLNTVTKINNICGPGNLSDCGFSPSNIATLNGDILTSFPTGWGGLGLDMGSAMGSAASSYSSYGGGGYSSSGGGYNCGYCGYSCGYSSTGWAIGDSAAMAAFETGNGESVVLYYNPDCIPDQEVTPTTGNIESWFQYVCVNLVYDLNNNKGPNTVGKDIGFMTVFYPMDSMVVSPNPDISNSSGCGGEDFRLPNKYEAASISLNEKFMSNAKAGTNSYKSSSKAASSSSMFNIYVNKFNFAGTTGTPSASTRCVKR